MTSFYINTYKNVNYNLLVVFEEIIDQEAFQRYQVCNNLADVCLTLGVF